jgi:hypothetical protein
MWMRMRIIIPTAPAPLRLTLELGELGLGGLVPGGLELLRIVSIHNQ